VAHEDNTGKIIGNTRFLLAVRRKRKIADDFIGQSFSDLIRCRLQHRSITLNLQRKNKCFDKAIRKRRGKQQASGCNIQNNVIRSFIIAATLTTQRDGRHTLMRPANEELCIQKRKGARTTEKYAQPLMEGVSPIHGYDLHLSGPCIQSLQTITVSVANEKSKWQDIEQKQKSRMASNSHVRPEQSGRVRKLANEA
jgi:hypothetical protein